MAIELIDALNYFPGTIQHPIKLEIIATDASINGNYLAVIRFIRKVGLFCPYSPILFY